MPKELKRSDQLAGKKNIREQLEKIYEAIVTGFNNQRERSDSNIDNWEIYNCKLNDKQFYTGNSQAYVPLVHNAVEARKARALGRVFPQTGRYVEVTTEDGNIPHSTMALLETYVDDAQLHTKVVPAMLLAGDLEGQYSLCVTWEETERHTVSRETKPLVIGGIEHPELGEVEEVNAEIIQRGCPQVQVIHDSDFLILPATCEGIDDALMMGGSVTAVARWSKSRVEELLASGEIISDLDGSPEEIADTLVNQPRADDGTTKDTGKKIAQSMKIQTSGKVAIVFRTWAVLKIKQGPSTRSGEEEKRLCLAYFHLGGDEHILGAKLCPYWNDKPDYISLPVKKMPGQAKGMAPVNPCQQLQYIANDFANMGVDTGIFTVQPVILTDPEKNPRTGSMVLDTMAVWEMAPQSTQPLQFPPVYQHSFNFIEACERFINQTLSVSPAMMPQSTGVPGRRRTQGEIALEQQVDIMTTDDAAVVIEAVLTEVVQRFAEYDTQFRDYEETVRTYGDLGERLEMETVPAHVMNKKWRYRWFGVEQSRNAQLTQQKVAFLNVSMQQSQNPAVAAAGYRFNPIPAWVEITEAVLGPRTAKRTFVKLEDQFSIDPNVENFMMQEGHEANVSPFDDHQKHMQAHQPLTQDPNPLIAMRAARHLRAHQQALMSQAMAAMMQQAAQQMNPGGQQPTLRQAQGSAQRRPRAGAMTTMPRTGQQPAGAIHRDRLPAAGGVIPMPRRAS